MNTGFRSWTIKIEHKSGMRIVLLPESITSSILSIWTGYRCADCHEIRFPVEFWSKLSASVGVGQIPLVTSDARVMRFDHRLQRRWRRRRRIREQWLTATCCPLSYNLVSNRRAPWRRHLNAWHVLHPFAKCLLCVN